MEKNSKIYIAGHTGLVGSALVRKFTSEGYTNLVFTPYPEYDLRNQQQTNDFFQKEKPEYVIIAAAKVGGILANNTYRAEFIYDNIMIESNIIHAAYINKVKKLLFLGSSCIYPKNCPQPMKEEYLLTGPLEPTNEPYAIAKIAGIKMCENYYRQYGCNFYSVMPTNLYGPNDNFNLETSHVLPAILRKMHLAKCLESDDWQSIREDLNKYPIENINGKSSPEDILEILEKYGISISSSNPSLKNKKTISLPRNEVRMYRGENSCPVRDPCWDNSWTRNKKNNSCKLVQLVVKNIPGNSWTVSLSLWGSGSPRREFLYVDDLADAVLIFNE
ncbi:MAG: NAD-dependent epimerase/dehydratase family protein [Chloroflexi bacterium]|nr:NAD-dependent epimerase/dehydratase family protein [bacterium]MBU1662939.1 NAD-dependent epimerase/dehydratase family protein [Chloroflexota bacterium]